MKRVSVLSAFSTLIIGKLNGSIVFAASLRAKHEELARLSKFAISRFQLLLLLTFLTACGGVVSYVPVVSNVINPHELLAAASGAGYGGVIGSSYAYSDGTDGASGSSGVAGASTSDADGDGVLDASDVDDDGDGLIEISTAAQLNAVRYNLRGTGLDTSNDGDNTAGGSSLGCGGQNGVASCNGYELTADLDLSVYTNWEPIGDCGSGSCSNDETGKFNTVFEGNGYSVSNMTIHRTARSLAVGLFGAATHTSEFRNLRLTGLSITHDANVRNNRVGGLLGFSSYNYNTNDGVAIHNVSVTASNINGNYNVGGLLGHGIGSAISSSQVDIGSIIGFNYVGGLLGNGGSSTISFSHANLGSITGAGYVGALVGDGYRFTLSHSYAKADSITGNYNVGGLIGGGRAADIDSSYALTGSLTSSSSTSIGGLVGDTDSATNVAASYWWDGVATSHPISSSRAGEAKSILELRSPIDASGIYANWGNAWCNPATGEVTADSNSPLAIDANRAWDFGNSAQLPILTCFGSADAVSQRDALSAFIEVVRVVDADLDGIRNSADMCPNSSPANLVSDAGDIDGDGCYGNEDALPYDPTESRDTDGDGVGDNGDNCPHVANSNQRDSDGDATATSGGDACDDSHDLTTTSISGLPFVHSDAISPSGNEDWYELTLQATTEVIFSTTGTTYTFGELYRQTASSLAQVTTSNDFNGVNFRIRRSLAAGTYYLKVRGYNSGIAGDYILNVLNTDEDGDGVKFEIDVDDDGDGLIEISTVAQLNAIRYNLHGTGLDLTNSDRNNAAGGTSTGCGGGIAANGNRITSCSGYELVADIDLVAVGYTNWQPIGTFSAAFDGNGHTISNLKINRNSDNLGLFGTASNAAKFSNLVLTGVSIRGSANNVGGLLGAGIGTGTVTISNVGVIGTSISGSNNVGGLVGRGGDGYHGHHGANGNNGGRGNNAYGRAGDGGHGSSAYSGGSGGNAGDLSISSSYVKLTTINGGSGSVGGLVGRGGDGGDGGHGGHGGDGGDGGDGIGGDGGDGGDGGNAGNGGNGGNSGDVSISSSYTEIGTISSGRGYVGGLVGRGGYGGRGGDGRTGGTGGHGGRCSYCNEGGDGGDGRNGGNGGRGGTGGFVSISSSYAEVGSIAGNHYIGGLVGDGGRGGRGGYGGEGGRGGYGAGCSSCRNGGNPGHTGAWGVGGQNGYDARPTIDYSYAVTRRLSSNSASTTDGIIGGTITFTSVRDSYWWAGVSYVINGVASSRPGTERAPAQTGRAKTLRELRSQTTFAGIYNNWDNSRCSGRFAWHLGTSNQLPVLNCFGETQADRDTALTEQHNSRNDFFVGLPDTDRDGLLDAEDNCPAYANSNQADLDRDGQGDICDTNRFVVPFPGSADPNHRLFLRHQDSGGISFTGDEDWYEIYLSGSRILSFHTTGNTNTYGQLYKKVGSSVTLVKSDDNSYLGSNFRIIHPLTAGTYYIKVRGSSSSTGSYNLHVEDVWRGVTDIPNLPYHQSNTINPNDPNRHEIWYELKLDRTAKNIRFQTSGTTNTYGELYSATGTRLAFDEDSGAGTNFRINRDDISAGTYYLRVKGASPSTTGNFNLYIGGTSRYSVPFPGSSEPSSSYFRRHHFVDGLPNEGDENWHEFRLSGSRILSFHTTGSMNTYGELYKQTGSTRTRVRTDDNSYLGNNFRIIHPLTAGTYFLKVRGSGSSTGSYNLHVEDVWRGVTSIPNLPYYQSNTINPNDRDRQEIWYELNLDRDTRGIRFYTTGNTNTYGELYSATGTRLTYNDNSGSGNNFRISRSLSAGTYYLRVRGASSSTTGNFALWIEGTTRYSVPFPGSADPSSGDFLRYKLINNNIPQAGEETWHEFRLSRSRVLSFHTTGSMNTYGELYKQTGSTRTRVRTDDNSYLGNNFRIIHPLTAGTYFLKVSGAGSSTGSYNLHVEDVWRGVTSKSSLPYYQDNTINPNNRDHHEIWYQVDLDSATETIRFYTTGGTNTYGELYSTAGNRLAYDDNSGSGYNFRIKNSLSVGTYYLRVRGAYSNTQGNFALNIDRGFTSYSVPFPGSADPRSPLFLRKQWHHNIPGAGDENWYEFRLSGSRILSFHTTGSMNTYGELYKQTGSTRTRVRTDDNSYLGNNFRIIQPLTAGTYYLKVRGASSSTAGSYTMHVEDVWRGVTSKSSLPYYQDNTINPNNRDHHEIWYQVDLDSSSIIRFYTTGSTNAYGELYSAAGTLVTYNDNSGSGNNFRINRFLPAGTYYLRVKGASSNTAGNFALRIEAVPRGYSVPFPGSADPRSSSFLRHTTSGSISPAGDEDWYEFYLSSPRILSLHAVGGVDSYGELYKQSGSSLTRIRYDDNSYLGNNFRIIHPMDAGTYYLKVRGTRSSSTGSYNLYVEDVWRAVLSRYNLPYSQNSRIFPVAPGYADNHELWYQLNLDRYQSIRFYTTGNTNTYGELYNSAGTRLAYNDNSGSGSNFRISHALSSGTYYLRVRGGTLNTDGYLTVHIE